MEGAAGRRWVAAPLLRITPAAATATVAGAVVFGHDRPTEDDPEREQRVANAQLDDDERGQRQHGADQ